MLIGPLFRRELSISARRPRLYVIRTTYAASLLVLVATAWLLFTGAQHIRDLGDMSRFGARLFSILGPLQMVLVMFLASLGSASSVAQEKDRNTLILLLLTRMNRCELVLGKLFASLVPVLTLIITSFPVFYLTLMFGGVSEMQILRVTAVTLSTALVCASLGTVVAFWREQTYQAVALTALILVFWIAFGELLAFFSVSTFLPGTSGVFFAVVLSPWRAVLDAMRPETIFPCFFPVMALFFSGIICLWGILRVRVWNPPQTARSDSGEKNWDRRRISEVNTPELSSRVQQIHGEHFRTRHVWDNPVMWREIRTRAYGRRTLLIRIAYFLIFALCAFSVHGILNAVGEHVVLHESQLTLQLAFLILPLGLLSLALINAQAVTSITNEREGKSLDLLLVTDLSSREIIFGKIYGIFWNTREMWLLPLLLTFYLVFRDALTLEVALYIIIGFIILGIFSATLGIHSGMSYSGSRTAIGVSLGTIFFLFVGVGVCLRMMLALSGSFQAQLQPFLAFMVGGGLALYIAIGNRNPSSAIGIASFICPFATFYAITALMLNYTLGVFLVVAVTYGFTTAAMLVPALSEFEIASDRRS